MSSSWRFVSIICLSVAAFIAHSGKGAGAQEAQDAQALLNARCGTCHEAGADGQLSRISAARKTPEGWTMTLVRMMVVHGVELSADERRTLTKYLSDTRGLAPSETEGYRYVLEKTPGATDTGPTEELTQMCARCHTWARVALQRRTREDWAKLVEFHLGQYPTTEYQALGRDRDWLTIARTSVVDALAEALPLESEAWDQWKAKEHPDLSGTWRHAGRMPGAGATEGTATLTAKGDDSYDITVETQLPDGSTSRSTGSAIVYSGHEVRGSLTNDNGQAWRAVLGLDAGGTTLTGRWYYKGNDVIGGIVTSVRTDGEPQILSVVPDHIKAGETATVAVHGVGLSGDAAFGDGLTVTQKSASDATVVLEVTAQADAATGPRDLKIGDSTLAGALVVYDKVDRVAVVPEQTFARVGGNGGPIAPVPAQFEAVGYMAGADGEAGTDDDVRIGVMDADWKTEDFDEAAKALEDAKFAGKIDDSGLFQPAGAGPNPERKMNTNNAGNLAVIATVDDGGNKVEGRGQLFVTVQRFVDPPIR